MKKLLLFKMCFLLSLPLLHSQVPHTMGWVWAEHIGEYYPTIAAAHNAYLYRIGSLGDSFLIKYNAAGQIVRVRHSPDSFFMPRPSAAATTRWDEIYCAGLVKFDTSRTAPYYYGLAKYDSSGSPLWVKSPPGLKNTGGRNAMGSVSADPWGYAYTTGYYSDSAIFGTYRLSMYDSSSKQALLARYSPTGTALWGRTVHTGDHPYCFSSGGAVAADPQGYCYFSGSYFSDSLTIDGLSLTPPFPIHRSTNNNQSNYILKLDSSGHAVSGFNICDSAGRAIIGRITVDRSGNLIVAGYATSDSLMVGSRLFVTHYNSGLYYFITKISPTGNVIWLHTGETGLGYVSGLAADYWNNIYFGGFIGGAGFAWGGDTLTTNPQNGSVFLSLDSNGANICMQALETGLNVSIQLSADGRGHVYTSSSVYQGTLSLPTIGATLPVGGFIGRLAPCNGDTGTISDPNAIATVPDMGDDLEIYPNPNTGTATALYRLPVAAKGAVLRISDLLGREVWSYTAPAGLSEKPIAIHISGKGMYSVALISDGQLVSTRKFVVE